MAYTAWSVVFGEQPSAAKWNILGANDAALRDGSGLSITTANCIPALALATNAITLGSATITTNFTTASTTATQVTGLSASVTIPSGSRKVKITFWCDMLYNTTAAKFSVITLWDGTVGSGTLVGRLAEYTVTANTGSSQTCMAILTPSAGAKTYNVGLHTDSGGTAGIEAAATYPAFILVEAI